MQPVSAESRLERAREAFAALLDWQAGVISALECARRCPLTFSEWERVWSRVGRFTPRATVERVVRRHVLRGEGGVL